MRLGPRIPSPSYRDKLAREGPSCHLDLRCDPAEVLGLGRVSQGFIDFSNSCLQLLDLQGSLLAGRSGSPVTTVMPGALKNISGVYEATQLLLQFGALLQSFFVSSVDIFLPPR